MGNGSDATVTVQTLGRGGYRYIWRERTTVHDCVCVYVCVCVCVCVVTKLVDNNKSAAN